MDFITAAVAIGVPVVSGMAWLAYSNVKVFEQVFLKPVGPLALAGLVFGIGHLIGTASTQEAALKFVALKDADAAKAAIDASGVPAWTFLIFIAYCLLVWFLAWIGELAATERSKTVS